MFTLASGNFDLLAVNPGLLIWTLVTFLVVMFILKKFAWDVILKALEAREASVLSNLKKAETLRHEAEVMMKEYQAKVSHAREEASAILQNAEKLAADAKNKAVSDTAKELQQLKDNATREIELTKAKALKEIQAKVVQLSIALAEKVLEREMKESDHKDFIEKELSRLQN